MPPSFSVYTPCYNSAGTIHRTWESMRDQTFDDFEWIIVDDASTDGTAAKIEGFEGQFSGDLVFHRFERRRGKPVSINWAVERAQGDLFMIADSDDRFEPHALERFAEVWAGLPEPRRDAYAGIGARSKDPSGHIPGAVLPSDPMDGHLTDLYYTRPELVRVERCDAWRTEVLRKFPFPEVDLHVPESVVWMRIGQEYMMRFIGDALRTYYRDQEGALSKMPLAKFPEGARYASAAELNERFVYLRERPRALAKTVLHHNRFARQTGRGISNILSDLDAPLAKVLAVALYPPAVALAMKDRLQGRTAERSPTLKS